MTIYSVALFLHIVGALALFLDIGLEWTSLRHLRRATTAEQARDWLGVLAWLRRLGPASMAAILLPGLYMTATTWGEAAMRSWIGVGMAALLLLAGLGALTGPRLAGVGRAVAGERGALSPALRQRLREPLLWASIQTRAAIVVGVVFVMTIKPDLGGALLTVGAAAILGLAAALPAWGRDRAMDVAA